MRTADARASMLLARQKVDRARRALLAGTSKAETLYQIDQTGLAIEDAIAALPDEPMEGSGAR
jgi:hypothetical protein